MKMREIAADYRREGEKLRTRIRAIKARPAETKSEMLKKADRLRILEAMYRDVRDMAVICEQYYQRGYRMCRKYSLND